jgi:hypothetical protein
VIEQEKGKENRRARLVRERYRKKGEEDKPTAMKERKNERGHRVVFYYNNGAATRRTFNLFLIVSIATTVLPLFVTGRPYL